MSNLTINGVNTGIQQVRELQDGVTLEQVQKAIDGDGLDSVVFEKDGKAYLAWGDHLDFSSLTNIKQGDPIKANLDGQAVNLVLFENEINSAGEGAQQAWELGKKAVVGGGKLLGGQGLKIIGAGVTLGAFARLGGAAVASTAGQSFLSKLGIWTFGPAKELVSEAGSGFAKVAKWVGIGAAAAAVVGTAGLAIYGAARGQDPSKILSITKGK